MADNKKPEQGIGTQALDAESIKQRLDVFDNRLDNIDSIVSAVAERVMSQPVTLAITCPHCGGSVEVSIIGSQRPGK